MRITQPILVSFLGDLPVHAMRACAGAFGGLAQFRLRERRNRTTTTDNVGRKEMDDRNKSVQFLPCLSMFGLPPPPP